MLQTTTWVATFNGAEARFYHWRRADMALTLLDLGVADGDHRPEYADRPVRTYASARTARGTGDPKVDGERALERAFVARVANALAQNAAHFDRLVIAAPPRALGAFREVAAKAVMDKVKLEIGHDYVRTPPQQILERLNDHAV